MPGITVACMAIAVVLVIANMLLQHQKDLDRLHGYAQEDKAYTIRGTWKAMRAVRKAEKRRLKEQAARKLEQPQGPEVRIRGFEEK